jgi:hypothetical protein
MNPQTFSLVFAVLAWLLMTGQAPAETWSCTYSARPDGPLSFVKFVSVDGLLIEEPYGTRYRVLSDNAHALIAEDHYGDFDPVLVIPNIFIAAVLIDKASYRLTYTITHSSSDAKQWTGSCRKLEAPVPRQNEVAKAIDVK